MPDSWANTVVVELKKLPGCHLHKNINIHTILMAQERSEVEVYIMTADQSYSFRVWWKTQVCCSYRMETCIEVLTTHIPVQLNRFQWGSDQI